MTKLSSGQLNSSRSDAVFHFQQTYGHRGPQRLNGQLIHKTSIGQISPQRMLILERAAVNGVTANVLY